MNPAIDWLLDTDPSIRWQVMRDLTDTPAELVAAERSRVASEGWGAHLLDQQRPDGQWGDGGATPFWWSNMYTLVFLRDLGVEPTSPRRRRAVDLVRDKVTWYLLERRLLRRLSTGDIIEPMWAQFAFPPLWHYDVLRALDYLRAADVQPDARIEEGVAIVRARCQADGRWLLDLRHRDTLYEKFAGVVGEPNRWVTLRTRRVLDWSARRGRA
ncbi:MAG TPA: hypothetical protein VGF24_03255 [Vicinamibacterales bacterium]|jgi:hypothetical protein